MRRRLTLLSGLAVAVTAVLASVATYLVVQGELRGQVDDSLRTATRLAQRVSEDGPLPRPPRGARPPAGLGGPRFVGAIVDSNGDVQDPLGSGERLPRDPRFAEVAAGRRDAFFADVDSRGNHLRMYVSPIGNDRAAAVARSVDEYDEVLDRLRLLFAAIALASAIAAALLGRAVANASVAPIERLQEASEHVAQTQDLARRIDETGPRETRSLARQFNSMLDALERSSAALEESVASERRLIADASHELRTPLTSLRTNIEVLHAADGMSTEERSALLSDVEAQLEDFTATIDDVIELARGDEPARPRDFEPFRLDELVAEGVQRARVHWPGVRFQLDAEEARMDGDPARLARAVRNLLENAAKWSPEDGIVDVAVRPGLVTVRDHGPGIDGADLPHVFDRFYRGSTHGPTGTGLGLAIVRQVAEAHGGTVSAEPAEPGTKIALRC